MIKKSKGIDTENFEEILNKMKTIKIAFLTAFGKDEIMSRPMVAHFTDDDKTSMYFISSSDSDQLDIFMKNHDAVATMTDSSNNIYIEIKGQCYVTKSKEKIEPFWTSMTDLWFPDGLNDSDVSLIRLSIESLECWDSSGNSLLKVANMLLSKLTHTMPDIGEKKSVHL